MSAKKQLAWFFCFLVFLGANISVEVLLYYMVFFCIFLGILRVWAKSVQQWFVHGEALAKAGVRCPKCNGDKLWGGVSMVSILRKTWQKYPIECRDAKCGYRWDGRVSARMHKKPLSSEGMDIKIA